MAVADLTKYDMGVVECSIGNDVDIIPVFNGEFVKFKEAIEAESNSVKRIQDQLKMLVMSFDTSSIIDCNGDVVNLLKKLLQLSGEK